MKFHSIFVALLILLSPVVYGNHFKLIDDAAAWASEVTEQQVAELYVATFNRAPDKPGLDFWVKNSGFTIEQIAESFFDQTETQDIYPSGTTETVFVTSVYDNLFNRAPDAEGRSYWVDALGSGAVTRPVMIEAVKNGAQGTDAKIVVNKAEVGLYYASLGLEGGGFSLAGVTDAADTVTYSKDLIKGEVCLSAGGNWLNNACISGSNANILNVATSFDSDCTDNKCTLQAALNEATTNSGDTYMIKVAQGSYTGNFSYFPSGSNTGNIIITGGWSADFKSQTIDPTNTIMDGNSTGTVLNLKLDDLDNPNIVAGDIYVQGITFTNGNASIGGGLIAHTASPSRIDIIDCIIESNSAEDASGGCSLGVYDFNSDAGGDLYIYRNIIRNNKVISTSLNEGSGGGGAIFSTRLTVATNNLIYGNSVGNATYLNSDGGGLDVDILAGDFYFINNTVTENTVFSQDLNSSGGGISIATKPPGNGSMLSWAPGDVHVYNNIIYNNIVSNDQGNDIANKVRSADAAAGSTIIISYNDYGDLWTGSDSVIPSTVSNISLDPLLSANVSTLYQPTIGSPAIDAGLDSAPRLPSIDLQGRGRPLDGNGDGSSVTDIGSYEYSR